MSTQNTDNPQENNGDENGQGDDKPFRTFKTEQELTEFTKKQIDERLKSVNSKYADYDDVKKQLSEFQAKADGEKSETEKLQEQLAGLQNELTKQKVSALKASIVSKYGISEELTEFLQGDDIDSLTAQAEKLAKVSTQNKTVVKDEGSQSTPPPKNLQGKDAIAYAYRENNSKE